MEYFTPAKHVGDKKGRRERANHHLAGLKYMDDRIGSG